MNRFLKWAKPLLDKYQITLKFDTFLPGDVPGYKYEAKTGPVVVLDKNLPEERQNFSLAHEIAHIQLRHGNEVQTNEEYEANLLASEILLPEAEFRPVAWKTLRELKEDFAHASFEVIGRRKLKFVPGVLTIVDNGNTVRRLTSDGFSAPFQLTKEEKEAISISQDQHCDYCCPMEGGELNATYVDEGRGVIRVLLYASFEIYD